jgi:threonine/homoserine/homoserine lactone efflux protein
MVFYWLGGDDSFDTRTNQYAFSIFWNSSWNSKISSLIPAEALGYLISITIWGLIIGSVSKQFPSVPVILKLFSAGYILFLALKLWRTAIEMKTSIMRQFVHVSYFLQLLNPKALLFASAIFPTHVWQNASAYTSHMLVFLLLIVPIAFFWTFIGSVICSNKVTWLNQRNMQRTASLVLVSFTVPLSYSALLSL